MNFRVGSIGLEATSNLDGASVKLSISPLVDLGTKVVVVDNWHYAHGRHMGSTCWLTSLGFGTFGFFFLRSCFSDLRGTSKLLLVPVLWPPRLSRVPRSPYEGQRKHAALISDRFPRA